MSLRSRILLCRWGIWLALVAAAGASAQRNEANPFWLLLLVGAFVWVASRRPSNLVARGAWRRFARHVQAERVVEARRLLSELGPLYLGSKSARELVRIHEASLLIHEGRHADGCALLESIDRRALRPGWVPWMLNNLAWALAMTGQGERAVSTARESIEASAEAGDSPASTEDLRACQLGTLGAALVVAGKADDAVAYLEQALARGGKPYQQAARAFFLGEAARALGRSDDATRAWKRAVAEGPATELGKRAQARLDGVSAYR